MKEKPVWVIEYCGMCVGPEIHHRKDSVHEYECGSCGTGIPYSEILDYSDDNDGDKV